MGVALGFMGFDGVAAVLAVACLVQFEEGGRCPAVFMTQQGRSAHI